MRPVRRDDDKLQFRVTVMADWPGQGITTDNIEQVFTDIDGKVEKYYEEEYRERDRHDFRSSGYVDVHRGFEIEDAGNIAWAQITGSEIRYSVYGCDSVQDAHTHLSELFDENADRAITEFTSFPPLRAFQSSGLKIEPVEGKAITVDPTKNDRRKHNDGPLVEVGKKPNGDRGISRVGRWDIEYRVEDDGEAIVLFIHPEAYTVVLATEVGYVLEEFLKQEHLLVADEADIIVEES